MLLRVFWGAVTGTVLNLGLFTGFAIMNGTPAPSVKTPVALLTWPTGSVAATLAFAGIMYFLCLLIACMLIPGRVR